MKRRLRAVDLAYAAAAIDGEGSIGILMTSSLVVHVSVYNTCRAFPRFMQRLFDGALWSVKLKNRKRCWCWRVTAWKAVHVLKKVERYLIVKWRQARLALAFQREVGGRRVPGRAPVPLAIKRRRLWYKARMHRLNGWAPSRLHARRALA
jgi:hypothetical protein